MDEQPILIVDDDAEMRALLVEVLRQGGYLVEEAANGAEALVCLRNRSFAAILIDKNLPGLAGLHLLPSLRAICWNTPVILMTTLADTADYLDGLRGGTCECIFKPFRIEELLQVLRRALSPGNRSASPRLVAEGAP
jgi:DNA-binding response OmpR family regulator